MIIDTSINAHSDYITILFVVGYNNIKFVFGLMFK
jgi:hypothetical protein